MLLAAALTVVAAATPQPVAAAATPQPFEVSPWTEAVVSVRAPEQAARLFLQAGGWRVIAKGRLTTGELAHWRLPTGAGGRYLRVCAPAVATGCIRFVAFSGVAQRPIRLAARGWDTGGIFSVMVRSDNVRALFDSAIGLGWWAESEPIAFDFGGSALRNVVLQGPDGFNLAVYERTSPPFTAFPVGRISQAFNSMRMVRDQRASVAFYKNLGFKPVFDSDYLDPKPQENNFSLPQNLTTIVVRRASALQPVDGETGRVEVMQFVDLTGKDAAPFAHAANLGILSVRYPVRGLNAYRAQLVAKGIAVTEIGAATVGGLGRVAVFAVTDPDGAVTEFYEARP